MRSLSFAWMPRGWKGLQRGDGLFFVYVCGVEGEREVYCSCLSAMSELVTFDMLIVI